MFVTFLVWNIVGFVILGIGSTGAERGPLYMADGLEFMNPTFVYKYARVNCFGAIVLSLFYSALFPMGAVGYWVYKLCTFGRK